MLDGGWRGFGIGPRQRAGKSEQFPLYLVGLALRLHLVDDLARTFAERERPVRFDQRTTPQFL